MMPILSLSRNLYYQVVCTHHSATTAIALVNGHSVIHLDFHLWHRDRYRCAVLWYFYLSFYSCLLERLRRVDSSG